MPCNLAVTITKAAVNKAELLALLTPEIVKTLVEGFIAQHSTFAPYRPGRIFVSGDIVYGYLVGRGQRFYIHQGQVSVTFPRGQEKEAEEINTLLSALISKGADRLFAEKVRKTLQQFGKVESKQATAKEDNQVISVTVLKLEV